MKGNEIFLSRTVVLECEWVLRSAYGYSSSEVCGAFRAFAGLATVSVEDPAMVARALDLAGDSVDFADALHVGAAVDCEIFATFDRVN